MTFTDSVASAISGTLKKTAQVVVPDSKCYSVVTADLVPIMRQYNKNLRLNPA